MSTLRLSYARGLLSLEGGCATALSAARPRLRADSTKGAPGCQAVLGPIRVDLLEATAGGAWERGRRRRVRHRRGKIDQQTASVARVPDPRIRPSESDVLIASVWMRTTTEK